MATQHSSVVMPLSARFIRRHLRKAYSAWLWSSRNEVFYL